MELSMTLPDGPAAPSSGETTLPLTRQRKPENCNSWGSMLKSPAITTGLLMTRMAVAMPSRTRRSQAERPSPIFE
eukprot:2926545-Pyramimonas_sp.AAC.1